MSLVIFQGHFYFSSLILLKHQFRVESCFRLDNDSIPLGSKVTTVNADGKEHGIAHAASEEREMRL